MRSSTRTRPQRLAFTARLAAAVITCLAALARPGAAQTISAASVTFTVNSPTLPPTQGLTVSNTGSTMLRGLALGAPSYSGPYKDNWLVVGTPSIDSIAPGTSTNIPLSVRATDTLPAGNYTATIPITSSNATNSPSSVTVTLVNTGPILSMGQTQFNVVSNKATPNPFIPLHLTNTGSSTAIHLVTPTVTYAPGELTGWLGLRWDEMFPEIRSLAPGTETGILDASIAPGFAGAGLPPGTYHGSFNVTASNAPSVPVSVTLTVVEGPLMALSTTAISFYSSPAAPPPPAQTFIVSDTGSQSLLNFTVGPPTYPANQPTGWLTVARATTGYVGPNLDAQSTAQFQASVLPGALPAGSYPATIPISYSDATGAVTRRSVAVMLEVGTASSAMVLSAASLHFTAHYGDSLPAPQTITVTNSASGSLAGLTVTNSSGLNITFKTLSISSTTTPATITVQPYVRNPFATASSTTTGEITVQSSATGVSNNPTHVPVIVDYVYAPSGKLAFSQPSTIVTVSAGSAPVVAGIALVNTSAQDISITAPPTISYPTGAAATGWLQAAAGWIGPVHAGETATRDIQVSPGALSPATYSATLSVPTSTGETIATTIALTIASPTAPNFTVSPTSLAFAATSPAPKPAAQPISIKNISPLSVSGLRTSAIDASGQPATWLSVTQPAATVLDQNGTTTATVSVDATGLLPGTYSAHVAVSSTNAVPLEQDVGVLLIVGAPAGSPTISLAPSTVAFTARVGGAEPPAQNVAITNAGTGTLRVAVDTVTYGGGQPSGWLTATLAAATAPTILTLQPNVVGLAAGTYAASVSIASTTAGVTNSPQSIIVTLLVGAAPPTSPGTIALGTESAAFTAQAGAANPAAQSIAVTNSGGGILSVALGAITYADGQPTGWLTATLGNITSPTTVTLQPDITGLSVGTYTATVPVTSLTPGVTNSPQPITVRLTVANAPPPPTPHVILSSNALKLTAPSGGAAPPATTVNVTSATPAAGLASTITYGAGASGWLSAALSAQTTPATLQLTATPTRLTPGTYTAMVAVSAGGDSTSTSTVTVTLTVAEPTAAAVVADFFAALNGSTGMGDDVRHYLDVKGNNNGLLDLGDILAYFDRTGATLDQQTLTALTAAAATAPAVPVRAPSSSSPKVKP